MDNEIFSSFGTQYIICECGDNFANEELLQIHIENGHQDADAFQCDVCLKVFSTPSLLAQHSKKHTAKVEIVKSKPSKQNALKREATKSVKQTDDKLVFKKIQHLVKQPSVKVAEEKPKEVFKIQSVKIEKTKKPPVIQLKNLKRIDSINLLKNLKLGGFIKLEPSQVMQQDFIKVEAKEPLEEAVMQSVSDDHRSHVEADDAGLINVGGMIGDAELEDGTGVEYAIGVTDGTVALMDDAVALTDVAQSGAITDDVLENTVQLNIKNEVEDVNEEICFQCEMCHGLFATEADFEVHYQEMHMNVKMELAEEDLPEVKQEVQEETYYYECELCHKIYGSEKYFNKHFQDVHGGILTLDADSEAELITSDMPDEEGLIESQALQEVISQEELHHTKAPEQVVYYKCDLCKILYPSEKAYNTHFSKKHGPCTDLSSPGLGFKLIEQDLTQQYVSSIDANQEKLECEFCSKSFLVKRSLLIHRKRVHGDKLSTQEHPEESRVKTSSRSKVCDICGRAYNSNAALRYHQRRHTGEKPYACTMCPKRFTMPMFLQIHTRTHTGEKPYECPLCPKAFTNKAALIRHDRVHTGIKPYPCPECGKTFTQSNSMKLHVSTVHLKQPAPYKSRSRRDKSRARQNALALRQETKVHAYSAPA